MSNNKSDERKKILEDLDKEYDKTRQLTEKAHEQRSKSGAALNQQHHDITQQLREKFDREVMLAKQCLKEDDIPGYHLHRIEADRWHRELEQR